MTLSTSFKFNLTHFFESSALFQGGVGRTIREDGVLLKFDFFKTKFDQNKHHFYTLLSVSIVVSVSVQVVQ